MNSKVDGKYREYMNNLFLQSQQSFSGIQTPGWTSIMNTQQSNYLKNSIQSKQSRNYNHQQILNRLKSLPKIDEQNKFYSNIRANSPLQKNKNVIVCPYTETEEKIKNQKGQSSNSQKFLKRFSSNKSVKDTSHYVRQSPKSLRKSPRDSFSLREKKRSTSFKSQLKQQNLTYRIQQRISASKHKYIASDFDKNFAYMSTNNQRLNNGHKYEKLKKFNQGKTISRQYFNKYKEKLNQRNLQSFANLRKQNENKALNRKNDTNNALKEITNLNDQKRFNAISIHEHLYHTNQKYEAKKNMYKMIQDSYQKATTLTFNPQISEKSKLLAESKFSKKQNLAFQFKIEESDIHQNCLKVSRKQNEVISKRKQHSVDKKIYQQFIAKQKQKEAENFSNIIYAEDKEQLIQQNMEQNLQKLPLSLIKLLNPVITKIYQLTKIKKDQFIKFCNNNVEMCSKRNTIISFIEKILASTASNKSENKTQAQTKFNTNA